MTLRSFLLGCLCALHFANAYAIQETGLKHTHKPVPVNNKVTHHSSSYIGKELDKQKQNINSLNTDIDDIKLLTTIHLQPTQSFFAYQHERFSRFLQALFADPNS
ncbi:hypothetical protein [Acinetobacter sp.]|uniref:hypothetical protein n=1 Tax=Acinetobacter sp. TaxID=472 RepID=UPI0031DE8AB3